MKVKENHSHFLRENGKNNNSHTLTQLQKKREHRELNSDDAKFFFSAFPLFAFYFCFLLCFSHTGTKTEPLISLNFECTHLVSVVVCLRT